MRRAIHHQRTAWFEQHALLSFGRELQRFERRIKLRTLATLRFLLPVGLIQRVMLRVEKALSHHCDRAHERAGIRVFIFLMCLEGDVLKHIRLEDDFVRVEFSQCHQRTRAAHDPARRRDDRCGEAQFTQRFDHFLVRRIAAHCARFWHDLGNLVARAALSGVSALPGHAKEIYSARCERGGFNRFAEAGGDR